MIHGPFSFFCFVFSCSLYFLSAFLLTGIVSHSKGAILGELQPHMRWRLTSRRQSHLNLPYLIDLTVESPSGAELEAL